MSRRISEGGGPGSMGGLTSGGSTRRLRVLSMSRQVLVTIRYIHARKLACGSYESRLRQALNLASCTASSAS
jgi:hypothetical protein